MQVEEKEIYDPSGEATLYNEPESAPFGASISAIHYYTSLWREWYKALSNVDRFDYILRDCKYTGIRFSFELDTILKNTFIQDNGIVFSDKARCSIDSFFHTRYSLYKQICNHPTVIAIEHHMKEVLTLVLCHLSER